MTTKTKTQAGKVQPLKASPTKPAKSPQGRDTVYEQEVADRICELLADGKTLNSICKTNPDFPKPRTIRRWAMDPEHPFSPQYARAREVGYQSMSDEFIDIGDRVREDAAAVAKARLRADSRKWLLSKALPKIYGDKLELDTPVEGALAKGLTAVSAAVLAAITPQSGDGD